jgi:hypothetical protein
LWERIWSLRRSWLDKDVDLDWVAMLCETMDERMFVRAQVLAGATWRERVALRGLDSQITDMLAALALNPTERKAIGQAGGQDDSNSRLAQLRKQAKLAQR